MTTAVARELDGLMAANVVLSSLVLVILDSLDLFAEE